MASRSIRYKSLSIRTPRFVGVGVGDDNDAAAFLQEAGIADYMQQRAIFELVSRLKGAGLWSKMKAVYPFIGGTASTHKWNLKDPQDTDAAFRLTFSGGWTHSATGALPNGTNAWANTFMTFATMATSSHHLSYYSRTNNGAANAFDIGLTDAAADASAIVISWTSGLGSLSRIAQSFATVYTPTTTAHYHVVSSNSSNTSRVYENGAYKGQNTGTQTGLGNRYYYIGAANQNASDTNNGIASFFTVRQCAFATIGDGLTDTEASALYDIVDLYQKRLSRAV